MRTFQNVRVFLVEDEFLVGSALQSDLEARGFHVFGPFPTLALAQAAVGADEYDVADRSSRAAAARRTRARSSTGVARQALWASWAASSRARASGSLRDSCSARTTPVAGFTERMSIGWLRACGRTGCDDASQPSLQSCVSANPSRIAGIGRLADGLERRADRREVPPGRSAWVRAASWPGPGRPWARPAGRGQAESA